jgi:hypothetical protein
LKLVIAHYNAGSRKRGGLLGQVGCANGKELPIASPLLLSLVVTINTVAVSALRGHYCRSQLNGCLWAPAFGLMHPLWSAPLAIAADWPVLSCCWRGGLLANGLDDHAG